MAFNMKNSISSLCNLVLFGTLATGASIPRYFQPSAFTRRQLDPTQVQQELGSQLSNTTSIFGPDDDRYPEATTRWNTFAVPKIQIVVEPGEESDVSTIVKYCNENSLEFLAVNRAHGASKGLRAFNGIQINLKNLRNIDIQPGGESAWFEGGVYDGPVMNYLWDQGYVTTTGSCDCVGMMGPGLGGGYNRHQGLHGMISDNILQLNLVLADGSTIRVNKDSHNDLLWAMKGAGHNFGIVTSFEMPLWPRGPDTWHYHNYVWKGDKLEDIFNALNVFHGNGSTPVGMAFNFGNFQMNTTISDKEPVIFWTFAYRGSAEEAESHLAPFNAIGAVYEESGDVPYPRISYAQGTNEDSTLCQDNIYRIPATTGLEVYNVTAERLIFDGFKRRAASNPALAAGGNILHEAYSDEAVLAHDPDDSAFPFRSDHLLMLFQTIVPDDDPSLAKDVQEWATEVRDQWNEGQPGRPIHAYVNYANGFEPLEQVYGHEPWRLERLRNLKAKYDPYNRFRFFNPIIQDKEV
ncbi:FAD-binding domain-containing protein [Daldinia caldariorum]|uniref:FAD-binding domain-containing protein n=1 Tax=Daldinia caldariorum TaxID=326644 RepID=UPI002007BE26|nr:FAD-binding domain-containing protein [Daldinia caldariorum]KAI1468333.1 FAD-binding domain-containing protein [Daldinia caldariorum]